ncbi:MAG: methylated-DNA--[protein]-cysteine S-methyltransferase [Pseudomonadota bacterium]|nr:methylated-DNA--[protein]-cysteine S-methyltransferase [Pseudomonadota bacterium]
MYARDTALIATPIGGIRIEGDGYAIDRIRIEPLTVGEIDPSTAVLREATEQLLEWFAGTRTLFNLPLSPAATPRGQALRDGMVAIKYAETMSYGELARHMESGSRAIGQACARNPFPIVVPCHRVLGAGDTLGHYSGGDGLPTKIWLLEHERRHAGSTLL